MRSRIIRYISVAMNIITAVLAIGAVAWYFNDNGVFDPVQVRVFRYFTTDSNLFAAAAALVIAVFQIRKKSSKGVLVFKYIGAVLTFITFMTVLCFLGPISGYHGVYSDEAFWLHLVCPLGFALSFLFFDMRGISVARRDILKALIPVVIYGIVYFVMVVLLGKENGGWEDFYAFNVGGMWSVTLVSMILASAVIAAVIRLIRNAVSGEKDS